MLDSMFSNGDVHTEIRINQITVDVAYRLGKAKPYYNCPMMVVLCKLSDKDFIIKNQKKLPKMSLLMETIWWRYSKEDTFSGQF